MIRKEEGTGRQKTERRRRKERKARKRLDEGGIAMKHET